MFCFLPRDVSCVHFSKLYFVQICVSDIHHLECKQNLRYEGCPFSKASRRISKHPVKYFRNGLRQVRKHCLKIRQCISMEEYFIKEDILYDTAM